MTTGKKEVTKQPAQTPVETERIRTGRVYIPRVDIYEARDAIVLIADMPGVDEKTVDITIEKNVLTVKGVVEAVTYKDHGLTYAEYDTGDYERAFTISDEVDRDSIDASVKNGILRIVLHKAEKAKVKKVAIKAA